MKMKGRKDDVNRQPYKIISSHDFPTSSHNVTVVRNISFSAVKTVKSIYIYIDKSPLISGDILTISIHSYHYSYTLFNPKLPIYLTPYHSSSYGTTLLLSRPESFHQLANPATLLDCCCYLIYLLHLSIFFCYSFFFLVHPFQSSTIIPRIEADRLRQIVY